MSRKYKEEAQALIEARQVYSQRPMFEKRPLSLREGMSFDAGFDAALEYARPQWVKIDGPESLPQWPKSYLWQYTTTKGKVTFKVQHFPVTHSREWFASAYDAWMPLPEPYQQEGL